MKYWLVLQCLRCLSVTQLKSTAAYAVYAARCVHGVIRCSLRQMPLASCSLTYRYFSLVFFDLLLNYFLYYAHKHFLLVQEKLTKQLNVSTNIHQTDGNCNLVTDGMIDYQLLQPVVPPRPLCYKVAVCKRLRQLHCKTDVLLNTVTLCQQYTELYTAVCTCYRTFHANHWNITGLFTAVKSIHSSLKA